MRSYLTSVQHLEYLTPRLVRVTVGGAGLLDFPGGRRPDERIKLFFPPSFGVKPIMPVYGASGWEFPEGGDWSMSRTYSVRRFDPDTCELDIDFALHGAGVADDWVTTTQPGDILGFIGPSCSYQPAPDARWFLVAGDASALPALCTVLEHLPAGAHAEVIVEAGYSLPGLDATWVRPGQLEDAVRAVRWPEHDAVQVWVAGETAVVRDIRRYVRHERGLDRKRLHASGYWRRGVDQVTWAESDAALARQGVDLEELV